MFLDPLRPKTPNTFGTADFMEVREAFELHLYEPGAGKWLCPYVGGLARSQNASEPVLELYSRPASFIPGRKRRDHLELRESSGHLLTFAPTRAGKGVGQIIPNLLTWEGSCLVLDVKGENYLKSAGYRAKECKQRVFRFAPFEEEGRDIWNPIMSISTRTRQEEEEDARYLVNLIVTPSGSSNDRFWENSARNFLEGLVLYVRTAPLVQGEPPSGSAGNDPKADRAKRFEQAIYEAQVQERSMREVRRLLTLGEESFKALLIAMSALSDRPLVSQAGDNMQKLMKGEGRTGTGILSVALEQTAVWAYDRVHQTTYKASTDPKSREPAPNDFEFSHLRHQNTTIYLIIPPDYLAEYRSVLRVLIGTAMRDLRRTYNDQTKNRTPVLMMLDEFPQLGYMQPIEQSLLYIAGYGVRYWFFVQDISQLQLYYPNSWRTFMANTGTQCFFGVSDIATANLVSEMVGSTTVVNRSYGANAGWSYTEGEQDSVSNSSGWSSGGGSSSGPQGSGTSSHWGNSGGETVTHGTSRTFGINAGRSAQMGYVGRRLITPDEVMRMHDEEQIIFMKGLKPIRSSKPPYYINTEMLRREKILPPFTINFY